MSGGLDVYDCLLLDRIVLAPTTLISVDSTFSKVNPEFASI